MSSFGENKQARLVSVMTRRLQTVLTLEEAELRLLGRLHLYHHQYEKNSSISQQGKSEKPVALLERGIVYSYRCTPEGARYVFDVHFPGEFIGLANLDAPDRNHGIRTLTNSAAIFMDQHEAKLLLDYSSRITRSLLYLLSHQQRMLTERMLCIARFSAPQRIARLLLEMRQRCIHSAQFSSSAAMVQEPGITAPLNSPNRICLPQTVIADMLGLSVVHVNRTLKSLRQHGLVTICSRGIDIVNLSELEEVACCPEEAMLFLE